MPERKRKRPTKNTQAPLITNGTTFRLEQPKSSRKSKPSTATLVVQEINPVDGFVGFLRDHAIVGLSIGFILGNQMSAFVKVLVASFIDPLTQLFFGKALSTRTFYLHFHHHSALFSWGSVIYNIIILIFLLIFVYLAVRVFNLDKLDKPKEKK
jgi:large-conductance mechanosensitive channel